MGLSQRLMLKAMPLIFKFSICVQKALGKIAEAKTEAKYNKFEVIENLTSFFFSSYQEMP